jgi:signal transduction histidine kinase
MAALTMLLIVVAGGVESVDEDLAIDSLESTAEALTQTDEQLQAYGEDLKRRIEDWAEDEEGGRFDDWREDLPGLLVDVFDEEGSFADLVLRGPVDFGPTQRCKGSRGFVECSIEGAGVQGGSWATGAVERRAEAMSDEVPVVVHGFEVLDSNGEVLLVRFETDIFAANEVEISSGFDELAIVVLPLLLLGLGVITWFSLARALRPVEAMIDQVDGIGANSLDQRIPIPPADDELKHLATTMNRMLDRLQRASDSQRQFISDASHELRSPITATGATLEVARSNPDEADWEHVAAVVEEENARLANLVDDLLILARLDEEGAGGTNGTVDLEEVCLAEAERPHPVEVAVRVIAPARVNGNLSNLTRAIRNLVENAAAHAETLVRLEVDGSGDLAHVRVIDDGPGVPPEFAEKIFERFVRVDSSRSRDEHGGAGLGLAICRRIAESHGGTLELVQGVGEGTTFELVLPSG